MDSESVRGRSGKQTAQPVHFPTEEACTIVGVSPDRLPILAGRDFGGATFTLADILGVVVARELSVRADLEAFAEGLKQLFQVLAAAPDVERLDHVTAVMGPRTAELWTSDDLRDRTIPKGGAAVPLGPLLANLRDQVFA